MKFAYTILYVADVPKTLKFYETAFGFQTKMITPQNDYAELDTGNTTISFASFTLAQSNIKETFLKSDLKENPFGIELAFTSLNIEEDFEKAIQNGAVEVEKIKVKPWGQKVGYLKDNNGFLIEICTPI